MKITKLTVPLFAFILCICKAHAQEAHVFRTDVIIEKDLTVWGAINGNVSAREQSDWTEANPDSVSYIKHKPTGILTLDSIVNTPGESQTKIISQKGFTDAMDAIPGVVQAMGNDTAKVMSQDAVTRAVASIQPGGAGTDTVIYITSPSVWTAPYGVTAVDVFAVGGGASGAKHTYGGGGGGSGYVTFKKQLVVTPGEEYQIIIGDGGSGSSANNSIQSAGTASLIKYVNDTLLFAAGGSEGTSPVLGSNGGSGGGAGSYPLDGFNIGGQGGALGGNGTSVALYNGGRGNNVSTVCPFDGIIYAGAGGGGSYTPAITVYGGVGGGGDGHSETDGGNGSSNTGGGGGGTLSGKSGNGGSGIVIINYKK